MAISNELLSSTLFSIRDSEVDQLFKKTAFLEGARQKGGVEKLDGGIKIQRPLALVDHSTVTEHQTGYEPVSLAVKDVLQPAIYDWIDYSAPIVITRKEDLENSGEHAIVKIAEVRFKSVMNMLTRDLNQQILAGGVAGYAQLNTLNGEQSGTGFLEDGAAAAATQTNIIGGLGKAAVNVRGWYNARQTASSDFSANGKRAMDLLWTDIASVSPFGGPQWIIASTAAFANYKQDLFAVERFVDSKTLDGGVMTLSYNGAPLALDTHMPTNTGVGTNEYSMYFLNYDALKLCIHKDADFALDEFTSLDGYVARKATLYWKGQLIADHIASLGVLVDGDTI